MKILFRKTISILACLALVMGMLPAMPPIIAEGEDWDFPDPVVTIDPQDEPEGEAADVPADEGDGEELSEPDADDEIEPDETAGFDEIGEPGEEEPLFISAASVDLPIAPLSVSDLTYSYAEGLATVTGYTGSDTVLNIPASVVNPANGVTYSVVAIGNAAFAASKLTSITIPSSVTMIDVYAFRGSASLSTVSIPGSVTSIGAGAFENCTALGAITIPDSVKTLGNAAFAGCTNLSTINLGTGITSIPANAFARSGLMNFSLGNQITAIGDGAFSGSARLATLFVPASVTTIGATAFDNCPALILYGVLGSAIDVFAASRKLPFMGDPSDSSSLYEYSVAGGRATIIRYLGSEAYVTLPNTLGGALVGAIGDGAFQNSASLVDITLSKHITSIGYCAFMYATQLTTASLGNATSIGPSAFDGCAKLSSVTSMDSVTSIGDYAFRGCAALSSFVMPNSVTAMGVGVFASSGLTSVTLSANLTAIPRDAFMSCSKLRTVIMGNRVTTIGERAFRDCTTLGASVTLSTSLKTVGDEAFAGCVALQNLYFPDGTATIGAWAFSSCGNLLEVTFPQTVTFIDSTAFTGTGILRPLIKAVEGSYAEAFAKENGFPSADINGRVTVRVVYDEYGLVTGAGTYDWGAQVTLKALALKGYQFLHWIVNGNVVGGSEYSFIIHENTTLEAVFDWAGATKISLSPAGPLKIDVYQRVQLSTFILPKTRANQRITWKSSNAKVATVNASGLVEGVKVGKATITATTSDGSKQKATVVINVVQLVERITLSGADTVAGGKSITLKAAVAPSYAGNKKVVWSSSNPAAAAVSKSGKVTANKKLAAPTLVVISATAADGGGVRGTHLVLAVPITASVRILEGGNPAPATLGIDTGSDVRTIQLSAAASPEGARQVFTWKSSNNKVATVNAQGLVTGVGKGTATITASSTDGSGKKASIKISVAVMAKGLSITGGTSLAAAKSLTLKAALTPANVTNKKITWTSSNTAAATVSSAGKVTAKKVTSAQVVTITATAADGSRIAATHVITVFPASTGVQVDFNGTLLTGAMRLQIDVSQGPQSAQVNGRVSPASAAQGLAWTSSKPGVATVDSNGVITAHQVGTAVITAAAQDGSGKKASFNVVGYLSIQSISIEGNTDIAYGRSTTLSAVVTPTNATNKSVVWKSANPNIATVTANGVVTAKTVTGVQYVMIEASAADGGGVMTSRQITVRPPVTSLTITRDGAPAGGNLTMGMGSTVQLSATQAPMDASWMVAWSSSDSSIATVNASGTITPLKPGTATITARAADGTGVTATCRVTVQ